MISKHLKPMIIYLVFFGHSFINGAATIDVNDIDDNDLCVTFISAAGRGDLEAVKRILARGVDINANRDVPDSDGTNALVFASENFHPEIVKFLLESGASVDSVDKLGDTALIRCLTRLSLMLEDAEEPGETEKLFLNAFSVIKLLLNYKANVNARESNSSCTALMQASTCNTSYKNATSLIDHLVKCGATIDERNPLNWNMTALEVAVFTKQSNCIKALLNLDAFFDERTINIAKCGSPSGTNPHFLWHASDDIVKLLTDEPIRRHAASERFKTIAESLRRSFMSEKLQNLVKSYLSNQLDESDLVAQAAAHRKKEILKGLNGVPDMPYVIISLIMSYLPGENEEYVEAVKTKTSQPEILPISARKIFKAKRSVKL